MWGAVSIGRTARMTTWQSSVPGRRGLLGHMRRSMLELHNCRHKTAHTDTHTHTVVKKVAHTRLQSVGFQSWSRFLAVSLQVAWVINPAVACHFFQPGPQLPPQPLRGLLPISLLGEQRHDGRDLNPGPSAAESSTLTTPATEPPSHTAVKKVKQQQPAPFYDNYTGQPVLAGTSSLEL